MFRFCILVFFLVSSCGQYVENLRSDDFEPIYLATNDNEINEPGFGAIYNKNKSGLFAMESRASQGWRYSNCFIHRKFSSKSRKMPLVPRKVTPRLHFRIY